MSVDEFSERAATWDDDPAKQVRAAEVAEVIRRRLPLDRSLRVLEFGAGTGLLSRELMDEVGPILLTDAAPGMVEVSRQRIAELGCEASMSAEVLDPTADDPPTVEPVDLVWSSMALHHVDDVDKALAGLRGLLAPGGRLALADLDHDHDGGFHRERPGFDGHDGFDREALGATLERVGFEDVEFDTATVISKEVDGEMRHFPLFLVTARRAENGGRT